MMEKEKEEEKKKVFKDLQESPIFQLSLTSKELFHSNLLAWIGSWDWGNIDKSKKDHPFRVLMKELGAKHVDGWPDSWYVAREFRNFDLCVLDKMPKEFQEENAEDDDLNVLLVLENKVKSIPSIEQLHEYQDKILDICFEKVQTDTNNTIQFKWQLNEKSADQRTESKRKEKYQYANKKEYASQMKKDAMICIKKSVDFILLSMSHDFPEKNEIETENIWQLVDYSTYLSKLNSCTERLSNGLSKSILEDYCKQLQYLLKLHEEWTGGSITRKKFLYFEKKNNKRSSYRFYYQSLRKLRIHDLFQKQRYAKICSILKKRIQDEVILNHKNLTCVSHLDLTKEEPKDKVNVGFNYFHGEPLLDIWLGGNDNDYVYTIQVQGDYYEHGIHMKLDPGNSEGTNSTALWEKFWGSEEKQRWHWICKFENPFKKEGKIIPNNVSFPICKDDKGNSITVFEDNIVHPETSRNRKSGFFPFLKYEMDNGVTFIYQYRKLSDKATVDEVLKYIVADFKALCDREYPVQESLPLTPQPNL